MATTRATKKGKVVAGAKGSVAPKGKGKVGGGGVTTRARSRLEEDVDSEVESEEDSEEEEKDGKLRKWEKEREDRMRTMLPCDYAEYRLRLYNPVSGGGEVSDDDVHGWALSDGGRRAGLFCRPHSSLPTNTLLQQNSFDRTISHFYVQFMYGLLEATWARGWEKGGGGKVAINPYAAGFESMVGSGCSVC